MMQHVPYQFIPLCDHLYTQGWEGSQCILQMATQSVANWMEGCSFVSMRVQCRGGSLHIILCKKIDRYDYKNINNIHLLFCITKEISFSFDVPFQCNRTNRLYDCEE